MANKRKIKRAGWITGAVTLGVGAAVAAGVAAERALIRRDHRRDDPFKDEDYGTLHGTSIGPVASFDGTLLNVEELGSGPTVLFAHGFSLNLTNWHHQMKELAGDARLVLYDQRGHGRSGRPPSDDFSLEALARDLDAVLRDACGDEPAIIVGHSMGGMATLKFCEMFPEALGSRVSGLVLVDTTSADVMKGMLPAIAHRIEAVMMGLGDVGMRALAGRTERVDHVRARVANLVYVGTRLMGFGNEPSPSQVEFVERMLSEVPSDVWLPLMQTMMGMDVTDALPTITVPAQVIVGARDKLTPTGAAQRIAEGIPDADFAVMPNAGHMVMLEEPDAFNRHLRAFFARVWTSTTA
jgi:pimeloyl-ACP methyl ester carboxylesterase